MKQVLFIAYNFPPHGGAGVQRSLKFVKYLPDFGWRPLVISTTADAALIQDPTLLDDLPANTFIKRIPGFSIARLQTQAERYQLQKAAVLANVLLQVPDTVRFWARRAYTECLQLIHDEKPELIYTTSGPYSAHLLGRWLRAKTGVPWLADFRDPWSKNLLMPYPPGYRWLNAQIERRVLATADRVVCVSQPWLDDLQQNLGREPEKFTVIPNGYDDADIQPLPSPEPHERFTIMHLGTFYRNRRPDQTIAAVRHLISSGRVPVEQLRVVFIGRNARDQVPDEPPFETVDYVPHKELDTYRQQADVLLLILATSADNVGNHSGKLFEYIASNRPILGILPPGGVAEELINETQTGLAVDGDVKAIADGIESLYQRWKSGAMSWQPNWDIIQQYTRRHLTHKLATEFNILLEEKNP